MFLFHKARGKGGGNRGNGPSPSSVSNSDEKKEPLGIRKGGEVTKEVLG